MTTREEKTEAAERTEVKPETAPGGALSSRAGTAGGAKEAAPLTGTVAAPPDDARQLEREIARTREQLGETVQELVARVDVRARARARASEVSSQLRGRAAAVGTPAWEAMPENMRQTLTKGAGGARERWLPLAVAAGAVIAGCLALWRWKSRPRGATRRAGGSAGLVSRYRPASAPWPRTSAERSSAGLSRRSGLLCGPSRR